MSDKTVFLADDDPDDILFISATFEELFPGISLLTFRDGQDLIEHLREDQTANPCFFILDYSMPLCDGPGVVKWVQNSIYKNIPCFILSTSQTERHKEDCLRVGARAYFSKPTSDSGLKFLITELIRLSEVR